MLPRSVALVANTGWSIVRYRGVLIDALQRRGIRVTAIADFDRAELEMLRQRDVRAIPLPLQAAGQNPVQDLLYLRRLAGLLRTVGPDVVHLFTIKPMIYGGIAARLAGTPGIVVTVTGRGILESGRSRWLGPLLRALLKVSLAGRTRAIFQNGGDCEWFTSRRLVARARAEVIAGSGVDTSALVPLEDLEPSRRRTFVMAGRMLKSKGVLDFVEAARQVAKRHSDVAFVLFGGARDDYGSKNPDFIERAWLEDLNREGVITWRGRSAPEEVEAAMRSAAAVVLPSYYPEGVPRTLIEAAAAGAPIITTDMPGCRDTVIPGRSGFLVAPRAPDEIAAAMSALLDDPELLAGMAAAGRELAVRTFDSRLITHQTLVVYASALGGGAARSRPGTSDQAPTVEA